MSITRSPIGTTHLASNTHEASSNPSVKLAGRSHSRREDPVEELRQHPDYVEQRVRGVGLGAWGGPLRLDLEIDGETLTPLRSIYMARDAFLVGDDPFGGRVEVAFAPYLHTSEQAAREALRQAPFRSSELILYTHYRSSEGIIFPTTLSETTAPRVIHAVRELLAHEASNAQAASSVLLESFLLAAGPRYPLVTRTSTAPAGRLIIDAGRSLSTNEMAIAGKLVSEGHTVRVLSESAKRTADFLVDGVPTELKTISNLTSKDPSGALARRILEGAGQAGHIIVDVRNQTGMTRELAEQAARRAYGADKFRRIKRILLIGSDFELVVPRVP
jgi:hypothetical protein